MDGAAVTDMILRSVAAMRERGELPEMDAPRLALIHEHGPAGESYRCDIGYALASALTSRDNSTPPDELAGRVATYLQEVADLVPAYRDIASVQLDSDGALVVTMRPHKPA